MCPVDVHLQRGCEAGRLTGHEGIVRSVAVSRDGRHVLSGGWSGQDGHPLDAATGCLAASRDTPPRSVVSRSCPTAASPRLRATTRRSGFGTSTRGARLIRSGRLMGSVGWQLRPTGAVYDFVVVLGSRAQAMVLGGAYTELRRVGFGGAPPLPRLVHARRPPRRLGRV